MNLALKGTDYLLMLVILKLMVDVTRRLDSMSMMSSGSGSVPSMLILYLHLAPSCLTMTKSKEAFPGFMGLNKN